MPPFEILYEDNHLLVVNKPAGIPTMGALSGPSVHSLAADYLKQAYHKPGRAFVGIVSRLDALTSGVLVLARTSKAASRLSAQFAAKSQSTNSQSASNSPPSSKKPATGTTKLYLAAVEGDLTEPQGEWVDHVRKDDAAHRMRLVGPTVSGAKLARLRYTTVGTSADATVVAVELLTGRKHQIRLQFSDRGHPILGDRKYGATQRFSVPIALHSWRLKIVHPTKGNAMWFHADPPISWKSLRRGMRLGDQLDAQVADSFDLDLSCEP